MPLGGGGGLAFVGFAEGAFGFPGGGPGLLPFAGGLTGLPGGGGGFFPAAAASDKGWALGFAEGLGGRIACPVGSIVVARVLEPVAMDGGRDGREGALSPLNVFLRDVPMSLPALRKAGISCGVIFSPPPLLLLCEVG